MIKNKIKNTQIFNKIKKSNVYQYLRREFREIPMHIHLILDCNLNCIYCTNQQNPENKIEEYKIISGDKWIEAINRIKKSVTLTGGEPTLHPDFIKIVNGIDKSINVAVDTNLCWSDKFTEKFIKEVKRPVKFYGSYHPCSGKPERILRVIDKLREHNLIEGVIHIIEIDDRNFMKKAQEEFRKHRWNLIETKNICNSFPGCQMKFRKKVKCTGTGIFISPDGYRYQCISKLLRRQTPLENITKENLKQGKSSCICPDYGFCNPCDLDYEIEEIE